MGHLVTLSAANFCTRGFRKLLIHQYPSGDRGTVFAILPYSLQYYLFVDGSWRPACPLLAEDYCSIAGTHEGEQHRYHPGSRTLALLPNPSLHVTTPRLPPDLSGIPSIIEFLAIAGDRDTRHSGFNWHHPLGLPGPHPEAPPPATEVPNLVAA